MKYLKKFNIQFVGLKEGSHFFEYQINKKFFEAYHFDEFDKTNLLAKVKLEKKINLLEFDFQISGTVRLPCDVSNELFDQEIHGNLSLLVKFGLEYNEDNEDILILPYEEYEINIAQYLYELTVLSVPNKRIHPKVMDGTMKSKALEKLEELTIKENKPVAKTTDPRWDKLKDLLTDK
jgi:uncharacterized metal-binding protein YceD (DUF177 family)